MTSWCTIESDPGVFHELLHAFGCKGLTFEELWALDESAFEPLRPIYGLFFLFKWQKREARVASSGSEQPSGDDIVFCQQIISNACGTLALLNVLLNLKDFPIGATLEDFKSFTSGFDAGMRGMALAECDPIRTAHNSFARPEPFIHEERKARDDDDDVYHFIAYTPINGKVYELDGLANAPVDLGAVPEGVDWISIAAPAIQARINEYAASEIRFNLLAMCKDQLLSARQSASECVAKLRAIHEKLLQLSGGSVPPSIQVPDSVVASAGLEQEDVSEPLSASATAIDLPASADALCARYAELQGDLQGVAVHIARCVALSFDSTPYSTKGCSSASPSSDAQLITFALHSKAGHDLIIALFACRSEKEKHAQWAAENDRRRHNYVPFIIEALRQAAKAGPCDMDAATHPSCPPPCQ